MSFGIWIEPAMVSEDSELFRAHPDWAIRHPERPCCRGRNQLVLDLSRKEVAEYLRGCISALLQENRISYIKWDMNRHITDAFSAALPAGRQTELAHRYVLNYYWLMDALCKEFPDVIFEGCSSGGGRFDAGVLYYQPQIWTSDNSDAVSRMRIQYGTTYAYPCLLYTSLFGNFLCFVVKQHNMVAVPPHRPGDVQRNLVKKQQQGGNFVRHQLSWMIMPVVH